MDQYILTTVSGRGGEKPYSGLKRAKWSVEIYLNNGRVIRYTIDGWKHLQLDEFSTYGQTDGIFESSVTYCIENVFTSGRYLTVFQKFGKICV